jgi:hypothetical protein
MPKISGGGSTPMSQDEFYELLQQLTGTIDPIAPEEEAPPGPAPAPAQPQGATPVLTEDPLQEEAASQTAPPSPVLATAAAAPPPEAQRPASPATRAAPTLAAVVLAAAPRPTAQHVAAQPAPQAAAQPPPPQARRQPQGTPPTGLQPGYLRQPFYQPYYQPYCRLHPFYQPLPVYQPQPLPLSAQQPAAQRDEELRQCIASVKATTLQKMMGVEQAMRVAGTNRQGFLAAAAVLSDQLRLLMLLNHLLATS